jgi:hypothetical protein
MPGKKLTALAVMLFPAILVLAHPAVAHAGCTCQCINGHMQPLCDSTIDLPPLCPPTLCPLESPSLPPLETPTLPPLGTNSCHQARICDAYGNCRWQEVCQ